MVTVIVLLKLPAGGSTVGSGGTARISSPAPAPATTMTTIAATLRRVSLSSISSPDSADTAINTCCDLCVPKAATRIRLVTSAPTIAPTVLAA